ncbi:hypothetical protein LCGC14_1809430 [marine sediment metagenome]|uniref:Uncharacterized protein n=1 Tax=marine sediment metagenome TaxID=412755 RepID=A0A0F9GM25_9ZZZZ
MSLEFKQVGTGHRLGKGKLEQSMHQRAGKTVSERMPGAVVYQERLLDFSPEFHPFLNEEFGTAMNQNVTFGGTPEIIHNGGSSVEWTASAIQGTWNFADGGKISLTTADNNDEATFAEETPTTIDMSGFTALTGKINLTTYNEVNNSLIIEFDLAGTPVGNSVDLNDFINTSLIGTEQSFAISKSDLGLSTQSIDGFTITLTRIGGTKPTMIFDDIQIEQTGAPAIFKATTPKGTKFHISEIRLALVDNITGIVTGSTTTYPTMPGLAYNQLLGVSALTNGIVFRRVQSGETKFSVTIKQLGDFLATGGNLLNIMSDGTNTCITVQIEFPEPIILDGSRDDFLSYTISDNLSGLIEFRAAARGALEV